jgi:hypothetical protein
MFFWKSWCLPFPERLYQRSTKWKSWVQNEAAKVLWEMNQRVCGFEKKKKKRIFFVNKKQFAFDAKFSGELHNQKTERPRGIFWSSFPMVRRKSIFLSSLDVYAKYQLRTDIFSVFFLYGWLHKMKQKHSPRRSRRDSPFSTQRCVIW